MHYPHKWEDRERGERNGHPGRWIQCSGCGFRRFGFDEDTELQRRVGVILAFTEWLKEHPVYSMEQRSDPYLSELNFNEGKYGMRRGVHFDIADHCDHFQWIRARQLIETVQES